MASQPFGQGNTTKPSIAGKPPRRARTIAQPAYGLCLFECNMTSSHVGLSRRGNAASTGRIERGPALASISDRPARHNSSLFGLANRQPILSKSIGNARMANGAAER